MVLRVATCGGDGAAEAAACLPPVDIVLEAVAAPQRTVAVARGRRHLTPLASDLDALARLAARVMGTRIGLVTLILPDGQEHLGRSDRSLPTRTDVPDVNVQCAHVVAARSPLVFPDARAEPRFAEHPAAQAGVLRFYAGAPIVDRDGQVLGVVCAIDPEPREEVSELALSALADVAAEASTLLQASLRQAEQAAQRRVLASLANGDEDLVANDVMCSVLLLDPDTGLLNDIAGPSLHPDYRALVSGLLPGEGHGTCGTAVHRREPVVAADLADPQWALVREVTASYGLAACASLPVLDSTGEPLGTFALYRRRPGAPSAYEWAVLRDFSDLTRVVIEHARAR